MKEIYDIKKLADLARMDLSRKEIDSLAHDIERILAYIDKLQELSVDHVQPVSHISGLENMLRKDEAAPLLSDPEVLIAALPSKKDRWAKVSKIIDKG